MSNVFGSCVDKHATWEEGVDANGNPQVTFTSNVEDQEPVSLCLNPLKGATLNGEPVEVIDGILQLPTDMFGEGVISADGNTYTLTLPGQDPVDICLNPVKGATLNGEAVTVEDGILVLEDLFGEGGVSADGSTYTITLPGQTPVDICLDPVKTVNGVEPDADGAVELPSSTTVAEPEGFHTITTDDGVATEVCLDPVKTVTTVDANGDLIEGPNAPDADGNANAVGSTATPSADGTQHNILTSDGVVTPVCLNPAKSTVQDPATGVITTTYADGTTDTSDTKYSTTVPNADGSVHTITTDDGVPTDVCVNPVKDVRLNPDGTWQPVFQDGSLGEIIEDTIIPADGRSYFETAGPDTVDGEGNPIPAGTPVLSVEDGDGNYLGSKSCIDMTVVVALADGTVPEVVNGVQTLPPRSTKKGILNYSDEVVTEAVLTSDKYGLQVFDLAYANPAAVAGDPDFCVPEVPPCPERYQVFKDCAKGVDWSWSPSTGTWTMCGFCPSGDKTIAYPDEGIGVVLTNDDLISIAGQGPQIVQNNINSTTNDDCVPWMVCVHNRTAYTGSLLSPAYIQFTIGNGSQTSASPPNTGLTPQWNYNTLGNLPGRFVVLSSGDINNHFCAKINPGETLTTHQTLSVNVFSHQSSTISGNPVVIGGTFSQHVWSRCSDK